MKLAPTCLLVLMVLPLMTGEKKSGGHQRRSVKSMRALFRGHRQFECVEGGENCLVYNQCCSLTCCQTSTGKQCAADQSVGCDSDI
uniref:Conotoxin n=1 Tax=Conus betulinus TaxID=89764 RepID=A0A142C1F2_CONBE|nr:conotoxin [Conus betulinus]